MSQDTIIFIFILSFFISIVHMMFYESMKEEKGYNRKYNFWYIPGITFGHFFFWYFIVLLSHLLAY